MKEEIKNVEEAIAFYHTVICEMGKIWDDCEAGFTLETDGPMVHAPVEKSIRELNEYNSQAMNVFRQEGIDPQSVAHFFESVFVSRLVYNDRTWTPDGMDSLLMGKDETWEESQTRRKNFRMKVLSDTLERHDAVTIDPATKGMAINMSDLHPALGMFVAKVENYCSDIIIKHEEEISKDNSSPDELLKKLREVATEHGMGIETDESQEFDDEFMGMYA